MIAKQDWIFRGLTVLFTVGLLVAAERTTSHALNAPSGQVEVKIDNFTFGPDTLTVAAGTTVKWTNRDDIPHTVVSDDKATFKSKAMDTDESFSYTFNKPGTYTYFCSIHPKMVARVIVK
jgi:plastocyanin